MKKLIDGIKDFRKLVLPGIRHKFAILAQGQSPDVLFITCSDSRVAPNWFASTDPGDLFVVRNIGNLVPPSDELDDAPPADISALAAAEFSVKQLNVSHIVVCGHSECGAMHALCSGVALSGMPHLQTWLEHAKPALRQLHDGHSLDTKLSQINQLSQLNVLQQIEHLKTHPFIQQRLAQKTLEIHGWWFDIAQAGVFSFEASQKRFVLIE
jgi:carbonic anhydrase